MENTLIMNKLPLPRYYDGENWNTVFKPTRRSIPKYLHQDLPELKLIELKERFKQIGKFNCPGLDYFNDYIKKHKNNKDKKSKTSRTAAQKQQYQRVKEELQYALLLCDKESPVLDEVVNKSRSIKQPQVSKSVDKGKHFPNTIDLVFRNRKNLYVTQQKKRYDDNESPEMERRLNQLPMLSFN